MSRRALTAATRWPWYPTLLAASIVLSLFAAYPVDPGAGIRPLLIATCTGVLLTAIWVPVLGRDRGGAAAAITLMALVAATDPLRAFAFTGALAIIGVEAARTARGAMRLRIPWAQLTGALNVVLIVLVALQVGRAAVLRLQLTPLTMPPGWTALNTAAGPDIFLILADSHGRSDVLEQGYGYDMGAFRRAMESSGLVEARNSFANHSVTKYSLSVLLNGRPITELGQDLHQPADDGIPFQSLMASSSLRMLKAAGYETTVISSGYDHLSLRGVDHYRDEGPRAELEQALWRSTGIGRLSDTVTDGFTADARTRVLREIDALSALSTTPTSRPQFLLAHLPAPHLPLALNADCSLRRGDDYTLAAVARDYHPGDSTSIRIVADQTRCVDDLLAAAVQDLVEARPDAVVIVFSDHGPSERLDSWQPTEPGIRDRLANMFWARTPGHPGLFPDDITLVNVLPLLANAYLGTSIPLHPNDIYLGPTPANPYFQAYDPGVGLRSSRP